MPAEWDKHRATWLAWPKANDNWPRDREAIERLYLDLIAALVRGEEVCLLVDDAAAEDRVRKKLRARAVPPNQVKFYPVPTADVWIRDYGPNFIVKEKKGGGQDVAFNDWEFNAWGGKYEDRLSDDRVPAGIARHRFYPSFRPGIKLEGGAIEVNGAGLLMTTEQCLLHPNRNPGLSRARTEDTLKAYLGIDTVIWLKGGLAGDDTDGHIDEVARFVGPDTVVLAECRDPGDENASLLKENAQRLESSRTADGKKLRVVRLPLPGRMEGDAGRLPASYANFYIANACVVFPVFGAREDEPARLILEDLFSDREVIGVDSKKLIQGQGSIHCVTQQEPAGD